MKLNGTIFLSMCILLGFELGCAGARYDVTAATAKYPLSFSPALPDESGAILRLGEGLDATGFLNIDTTTYGFFYGATGDTVDISEEVNRQVKSQGGEGVVGLSLASTSCALNYLFPLMYLPFWPGCQGLTVTGRVVKVSRPKPEPPTSARSKGES